MCDRCAVEVYVVEQKPPYLLSMPRPTSSKVSDEVITFTSFGMHIRIETLYSRQTPIFTECSRFLAIGPRPVKLITATFIESDSEHAAILASATRVAAMLNVKINAQKKRNPESIGETCRETGRANKKGTNRPRDVSSRTAKSILSIGAKNTHQI